VKILHLPVNYGSLLSHTVRGLRQSGIEAYGLAFTASPTQSVDGVESVVQQSDALPSRLSSRLRWSIVFLRRMLSARPDLIHWYFGQNALPGGLDRMLVKALKVPRLVEWQGSDIRIPEVEFADNPFYKSAYENGYEYQRLESREQSLRRQRRFAEAGFASAAPVGMMQYVQREIFPHTYLVPQRLVVSDYVPVYPAKDETQPLVVHSPSAPFTKGTAAVLRAIEKLKPVRSFRFELVQGVPRHEALARIQRADIFLDQFVLGDRGMAALEAMALGKPVICYIKPSLVSQYPADTPIVNATQDTLADVLDELLGNATLRHTLGEQGRAYIEKYFEPSRTTAELMAVYRAVIAAHKS